MLSPTHISPVVPVTQNHLPFSPTALFKQLDKDGKSRFFLEDEKWLIEVDHHIRQNYTNNHFSVVQLADAVAISERQLRRRMKKLLGMGPWQYLTKIRLEFAFQILQQKKYKTLAQIAFAVGYRDVDSFRAKFKKAYGRTPMDLLR